MPASKISRRAYSYVRMSTELQADGDSFRRQSEKSKAFAEKRGLILDDQLKLDDIGVSAFDGKNIKEGALGLFLAAVSDGTVPKGSYLLVESLDRISRQDIRQSASLLLQILSSGINVVTVSDERIYGENTDFADLIYALVVLSRAHEESATKSMRLKSVWSQKRGQIEERKLTSIAPAWLTLSDDKSHFLVIESAAATVERMFHLANAGLGSYSIVRKFNAERVPTLGRAASWHESYVTKILTNRATIGEFQPFKMEEGKRAPTGEPIAGYFPQIVDTDLFYNVQAARRIRQTAGGGRKGKFLSNLFSHIATCGYCGSPMHFINKGQGPKGGKYLRCSSALRNTGCQSRNWRYDDFEESFLSFVTEVDLASVFSGAQKRSLHRELIDRRIALLEELSALELQRSRALDLYLKGGPSVDFVQARMNEITETIDLRTMEVAAINASLESKESGPPLSSGELKTLINDIQDISRTDLYEKRSLVAKRLREIVTVLSILTDGRFPLLGQVLKQMYEGEEDRVERYLEDTSQFGNKCPAFSVTLADGISRMAVVNRDDPSQLLVHVRSDGDLIQGAVLDQSFSILTNDPDRPST